MPGYRRVTALALLLAITAVPLSSTLTAAEPTASQPLTARTPPPLTLPSPDVLSSVNADQFAWQPSFADTASSAAMQRGRYRGGGRGYGGGRRSAAAGALIVGAAAAITGAAVLAYANRPDCDYDRRLAGCGYGTKVVGTSVLAGGLVGVLVGAALWR